jgi:hypothetical protein
MSYYLNLELFNKELYKQYLIRKKFKVLSFLNSNDELKEIFVLIKLKVCFLYFKKTITFFLHKNRKNNSSKNPDFFIKVIYNGNFMVLKSKKLENKSLLKINF